MIKRKNWALALFEARGACQNTHLPKSCCGEASDFTQKNSGFWCKDKFTEGGRVSASLLINFEAIVQLQSNLTETSKKPEISRQLLKTGGLEEVLRKQGVITEWQATLASLLSTRKFGNWWLTGLIHALASGKASVGAHSWLGCKVNQPCGTTWREVGFMELQWLQNCFNFFFFCLLLAEQQIEGGRGW